MREALIVWGGWSGHEPQECAEIIKNMLEEDGFKVYLEHSTEAFADPSIHDLSLIVPIMTMSKIEKEEVKNLAAAVENGVGIAGYHGGAGDAFRESVDYQFIIGGQWVAHPGNIIDYTVNVTRPDDPLMEGIADFPTRPSNITCMSIRRTRCSPPPHSPATMPTGSTAWSCRSSGSGNTERAASSIPPSAIRRRNSTCRR